MDVGQGKQKGQGQEGASIDLRQGQGQGGGLYTILTGLEIHQSVSIEGGRLEAQVRGVMSKFNGHMK